MKIRKIMQTELVVLRAEEPLIKALEATASERIRHLPIVDGDRLVGMVTITDIKHATPSPLIEGNQAEYRKILYDTPVSRIMRRSPITASPDATLAEVMRLMVANKIGCLPIVEGDKLVGIVSEIDVLKALLEVLEILE